MLPIDVTIFTTTRGIARKPGIPYNIEQVLTLNIILLCVRTTRVRTGIPTRRGRSSRGLHVSCDRDDSPTPSFCGTPRMTDETTLSRARVPPRREYTIHMSSSLFNYDGDSSYGDGNRITVLGSGRDVPYNMRCYFRW